jgi:hypothetical protein
MGTVQVAINLNDRGYSAAVERVRRQNKQLVDGVKEIEGKTASSMQASSAAIRVLEGGMTGNIRAAERFISLLPGVGKALQAAFPVVGGIALAGVFAKIGEEAYKTVHTIEQMRNVTREGLLSLTESSQKGVDSMRVANDKLEQQIAMMEHKPENGLALALDEARLKADDLAISLNKDYTAFKKLLEESKTSVLGQMIGKASGKDVQTGVNDRLANIRTLGIQQQDQLDDGNTSGAADTLAKLKAAEQEARNWQRQQVAMRQGKMASPNGDMLPYSSFYGDQGQNIDSLQGFGTVVRSQQDTQSEQERDSAGVVTQKKLEAANKAREAMAQAQAMLLTQDEEQLRAENAFNKLTVNETIAFWNDRLAAFQKGSKQFIDVQSKIYEEIAKRPDLTSENKKNQAAAGKSTVEGNDLLGNAQKALTQLNIEALERQNKQAEKYNEIVAKSAEIAAHNKAAFDEANVSIGLQQGTMSKLAAAQELARIHTQEHTDALKALNEELATQMRLIDNDPNPNLTADDRARARQNAQDASGNQASAINGTYAVTQQKDAANVYGNTSSGAAQDAFRIMMQNWSDMTQGILQAMTRAADSFNDDLVKAMTGHGKASDFGKTFTQLGDGLLKTSLQKGESMIFGKAGGLGSSQTNPMWTRDAGSGGAGRAGGQGGQGGQGGGSFWSKLFHSFLGGQQNQSGGGASSGGNTGSDSDSDGIGFDDMLQGTKPNPWGTFGGGLLKGFLGGVGGDSGSGGGGGQSSDQSQGGGNNSSMWGRLVGGGLGLALQGGFAGGGDVLANYPALVGEQGPELFMPRSAGRIIPNNALGGGGGGGDVHFHIDARGSNDPMAVHAAIMRAAPHIAAAAVQATHARASRTPRGR